MSLLESAESAFPFDAVEVKKDFPFVQRPANLDYERPSEILRDDRQLAGVDQVSPRAKPVKGQPAIDRTQGFYFRGEWFHEQSLLVGLLLGLAGGSFYHAPASGLGYSALCAVMVPAVLLGTHRLIKWVQRNG